MIYFDFDGTLVDVWKRYHKVFVEASQTSHVSFAEYVQAKRSLIQDTKIADKFHISLPATYRERKRLLLESDACLRQDTLLVSKEELLDFFSAFECRILTNRRNADAFRAQLEYLGLHQLIPQSIVLNPDNKITKQQFLLNDCANKPFCLIGDGDAESQVAEIPQSKVFLVDTGLRKPHTLPYADKCTIIKNVRDFINMNKYNKEID